MRTAPLYRAIALCVPMALLGASAWGESETGATELAHALPEATDWSRIPTSVAAIESDPFYSEDFDFEVAPSVADPFENTNRAVLTFNRGIDRMVLDPLTRGYQYVVPEPARMGVRRMFRNLNSPAILVNDLLQLRFRDAGETFGRFLLNTSLGIGGIFDVGTEAGWEHHSADFGQTLARAGVGSGPYLMLPIFGPNTVRDGVGDLVDRLFQPLTYLIGPTPNLMIGTGNGFAIREAKADALRALEESSVDYYAALRSAYIQNRQAQIWDTEDTEFESAAPSAE